MLADQLLQDDEDYHGRRDFRPWSLGKKICIYTMLVILSPLILVLLVIYILISCCAICCMSVNANQLASGKILGFEAWYKPPGKKLEVKATGLASSDIIIPYALVNDKGELDTCKRVSLRKSLECTVQDHCRKGPYGAKIEGDENRDQPHYLLHGWTDPFDPSGDEVWCTHARTATWAALYSWSGRIPAGGLTSWSQAIDLKNAPEVFGYIYLFEISNPEFYEGGSRVKYIGSEAVNAPDHTQATEGKIFARYNYGKAKYLGDFPEGDPDAYIFKGKVLHEAKLKILHEYRVMKPLSV